MSSEQTEYLLGYHIPLELEKANKCYKETLLQLNYIMINLSLV